VDGLVELRGVSKVYDGAMPHTALRGIDLTIASGQFVCVMGPSGSGKSTLLNIIAGLDRPTQGSVVVDGIDLGTLSEAGLARYRRRRVGLVFQFFNLLDDLTALENVLLVAQLAGVADGNGRPMARDLLDRLGLAGKLEQYPGTLSGGERQRVAIARAVMNRPALLLADEPTGALDSANGAQVLALIASLSQEGQTVLLVTHEPAIVERHASRIVRLRDGAIVDDGGPETAMRSGTGPGTS
jgi:putative ABC transport system ATP-binding protein